MESLTSFDSSSGGLSSVFESEGVSCEDGFGGSDWGAVVSCFSFFNSFDMFTVAVGLFSSNSISAFSVAGAELF